MFKSQILLKTYFLKSETSFDKCKLFDEFLLKFAGARGAKYVYLVDLVKNFSISFFEHDPYSNEYLLFTSIYYLLAKIGFATAESELFKIC